MFLTLAHLGAFSFLYHIYAKKLKLSGWLGVKPRGSSNNTVLVSQYIYWGKTRKLAGIHQIWPLDIHSHKARNQVQLHIVLAGSADTVLLLDRYADGFNQSYSPN